MKPLNTAAIRRAEKNLLKSIDAALMESASGVKKLSAADLKSLSDVLTRCKPPMSYVQQVLINQYAFLQEWQAGNDERADIERFLHDFQQQAAAELQQQAGTLLQGVELSQAGDPK